MTSTFSPPRLVPEVAALLGQIGVAESDWRGGTLAVRSPIDGGVLGHVAETPVAGVAEAVARAQVAWRVWRSMPAPRRGELVRLLGEELRTHKAALGRLLTGQGAEARYLLQVGLADRYTFWLRASSYQTRMWYQLDGGPRIDIDSDSDARETIRLNVPTGIDIRFLSWLRAAELDLDAGNHELRIGVEARRNGGQEAHGGIDALCLVNFPWAPTGALKPALAPRVRRADEHQRPRRIDRVERPARAHLLRH